MNDLDLRVRRWTYARFVALRRSPTADEVAGGLAIDRTEVDRSWRRLHDMHALVLDAGGTIRMLNPFSAVPTAYRVHAARHSWFANCAWDAFGICAALHSDGRIETCCADCGDPIAVEVRRGRADDDALVFHCLVPVARWWNDIVFT